jgi:hypothetical protein
MAKEKSNGLKENSHESRLNLTLLDCENPQPCTKLQDECCENGVCLKVEWDIIVQSSGCVLFAIRSVA